MSRHPDRLPQSPAVSALVRRVTMRLSGELAFNGHPTLSSVEVGGFFELGEACAQLDRLAILPGMAQHENRARRDLLELYDTFAQDAPTVGHTDPQESCAVCAATPQDAGDALGCMP